MIRNKHRIVSLLLILAFMPVAALTMSIKAEASTKTTPIVKVESVDVTAGSTVNVNIEISNNPGVLGAIFEVSYSDGLELSGAEAGTAFEALNMTKPGRFVSPCRFVWDGQELPPESIKDGIILTLVFQVPSDAQVGDSYSVQVSCGYGDVVDSDLNPVQIETVNGLISVVDAATENQPIISSATGTLNEDTLSLRIISQNAYTDAKLLIAGYAESGQMLGCSIQTINLTCGENRYQYQKAYGDVTYKAFLVDLNDSPFCPVIEFSKEPAPEFTEPTIVVNSVAVKPGDTDVEVKILIQNNPGILGMILTVSYDENALSLKNATNGTAVKDVLSLTTPGKYTTPCRFVWDGQEITQEDTKDGLLLTLTFDVSDTAANGSYLVGITYNNGDIIDNNLQAVEVTIQDGFINVNK